MINAGGGNDLVQVGKVTVAAASPVKGVGADHRAAEVLEAESVIEPSPVACAAPRRASETFTGWSSVAL